MQPRTFIVSLEDGQLLAKCQIFQREVSLSTEQQNDESHYDDNCIQHEKTTVPPSDEGKNGLGAQGVLANAGHGSGHIFIVSHVPR